MCIWFCFIALLVFGVVMVASTGLSAQAPHGSPEDYVWKQCRYGLIGLALALAISRVDYHLLRKFAWWIYGGCAFLLLLCFAPGVGQTINGESRWINVGLTFQPSEMAKIGLMIILAHWYTTYREVAGRFWDGFAIPGGLVFGIPLMLILFEKDMGTAAALAMCGFCVMYVSGARWWLILLAVLLGALVLYDLATGNANRMERINAWVNPQLYSQGAGRQQWVSILAFARGGLTGMGLGNGVEKLGSLPFAHTDFIFPAIGEEWGFVGTVGVLLLFTLMALSGIIMALQTHDTFGRILAVGLVSVVFWPAALNMLVATSLLPNTGIPLPFISYGGTNLVFTISAMGLLTSIQRHTPVLQQNYWPQRRLKDNPPEKIAL